MADFYPPITPFNTFFLKVSELHSIYVEEAGNPNGQPIIFLHGGPGGGIDAKHRQYFNPDKWRIILFDQRGCGLSTPFGELRENTTFDLVRDIEKIREKLGIAKWHVFGGSWGSTLSLAYAIKHPERVLGLILRGIFLLRKKEIEWFYQYGASEFYPHEWQQFLEPIPKEERYDLLTAYYKRLISSDEKTVRKAAMAWSIWEGSTAKLRKDSELVAQFGAEQFSYAFARIESHYFYHKGFFEDDNWILNHAYILKDIPGFIIQGRYDMPCPPSSAYDLSQAWPLAKLMLVEGAGHSASEVGIKDALIDATDVMG